MGVHSRRSPLILIVVAAVVVVGIILMAVIGLSMASVGSDDNELVPQGQVSAAVTSTSMDPAERCTVAVMSLLGQALAAVQQGYTSGLDPTQVASRYGTQSPVFRVWSATQTTLIGNVVSRGAEGQLGAIQGEVRTRCAELA